MTTKLEPTGDDDSRFTTVHEKAPWRARMWWEILNGRPEPLRIDLEAIGGKVPLTGSSVRGLPIGAWMSEARMLMRQTIPELADPYENLVIWVADVDADGAETHAKQTPPGKKAAGKLQRRPPTLVPRKGSLRGTALSEADLQAVADVYREAYKTGGVTKAVVEAFNIAPSTADRRIKLARAAGYLNNVGKGTR